mmetsp:Transcript_109299/g.326897  ORF Transcript_109299/g.326897 Transcript_109299/m.326897 type:complete len:99 (+) Transcript_109299:863-1159(+)
MYRVAKERLVVAVCPMLGSTTCRGDFALALTSGKSPHFLGVVQPTPAQLTAQQTRRSWWLKVKKQKDVMAVESAPMAASTRRDAVDNQGAWLQPGARS